MKQRTQRNYSMPFVFEVVVCKDNMYYSVAINRSDNVKYKVDYYAVCDNPNFNFLKKRYHEDFECYFNKAGTYRIALHGAFPGLCFKDYDRSGNELYWGSYWNGMGRQKLTRDNEDWYYRDYYGVYLSNIIAWGSNEWMNMERMFNGCRYIRISAMDAPDLRHVRSLYKMFNWCVYFNSYIDHWDVSQITDMSYMFANALRFNKPLNRWDVSHVKYMNGMFCFARSFNQPLDKWDVSNVTNMDEMFKNAWEFNQPLNTWNVSNVNHMASMFSVDRWRPTKYYDEDGLATIWNFSGNAEGCFNHPLDRWNVSNVEDMSDMFSGQTRFNQPLNAWDISKVKNMSRMFKGAESFKQCMADWDLSRVKHTEDMYADVG